MSRPTVSVFDVSGNTSSSIAIPDVFNAPLRADIVQNVTRALRRNLRHPYARNDYAGHKCSGLSWGTGRAVSRVPRVNGSGTHRNGQACFANSARGGRVFAPIKIWRRWAGRQPTNTRRYAIVSAISASAETALVKARGHKVDNIKQLPFVVSSDIESFQKTKQAEAFLKAVGAFDDVLKVKNTKTMRAGVGKRRNRRFRTRKGPLVVFKENKGVVNAFKNIPGVDVLCVDRMNLLELAPGGHLGRFIIWTEAAFKDLTKFGSYDNSTANSAFVKRSGGTPYNLPAPLMKNTDVSALIESDAIQGVATVAKDNIFAQKKKKINPYKSANAMKKLNKHGIAQKKRKVLAEYRAKLYKTEEAPEYVKKVIAKHQKRAAKRTNNALTNSLKA